MSRAIITPKPADKPKPSERPTMGVTLGDLLKAKLENQPKR